MVSRETRLQLVVGTLATACLLVAVTLTDRSTGGALLGGIVLVYYGIIFGGTHLYLAWRGEDGSVPADSRQRFLLTVALLLVLGAIGIFGPDSRLVGFRIDTYLAWSGAVILLSYWVLEARDGYLANCPT